MHYANSTLDNMPAIVAERMRQLSALYCPPLTRDLAVFAVEHGPAFGVTNETHPGMDPHDVTQRVLMTLEAVDGFPLVSDALVECRRRVQQQHKATSKRQHAMWILVCLAAAEAKERDTLPGNEVFKRWTSHVNAKAAVDALAHIVQCSQQMTRLAMLQIDMEYKSDGLRKAHAAGQLSAERLNAALIKTRTPRNVDYQRAQLFAKNLTLSPPLSTINVTDDK